VVEQQHLPDSLSGHQYYDPSTQGAERAVADRLAANREELSRRQAGS
jgi:replication-associated recombination protein RarA